jgi:hypothetical protein
VTDNGADVMLDSFTEQQHQEIEHLMESDDARKLAHRMHSSGWTNDRLIDFLVALAILEAEKVRYLLPV